MHIFKKTIKKVFVSLLILEARIVLWRHRPRIVTVTGSIGKTSTKDAIFTVISGSHAVRKSDKSFNTDVGIPLTILGLTNAWNSPIGWAKNLVKGAKVACSSGKYPEWLVLEVGADAPGDIASVASWVRPTVAVLTAVPDMPVHVEYFSSPEAVLKEKRILPDAVGPDGLIVLDGDCKHTNGIAQSFGERSVVRYGYDKKNDVHIATAKVLYEHEIPVGMHYSVAGDDATYQLEMRGILGKQSAYPAAAALAVAKYLQIPAEVATARLCEHEPPKGRMRVLEGIRGSTVIDDTYNASPEAVRAALEALQMVKTKGKKIAILGDMAELGKYAQQAHVEAGQLAQHCADIFITIGMRARDSAFAAQEAGMSENAVFSYKHGEWQTLTEQLLAIIEPHDIILLKGSQFIRLEKVAEHLILDKTRAHELLVRQDDEWRKR